MNKNFNQVKHTLTEKDQSNRKGKTFGINSRTKEELKRLTRMFSGRSLQEFKEYCIAQKKSFVYMRKYAELLGDVFSKQSAVQQSPIKIEDRNTELLELLLSKVEELTKKVEEQSKKIESLEATLAEVDSEKDESAINEKIGEKHTLDVNDLKNLFNSKETNSSFSSKEVSSLDEEAEKLRKENHKMLSDYKWEL